MNTLSIGIRATAKGASYARTYKYYEIFAYLAYLASLGILPK